MKKLMVGALSIVILYWVATIIVPPIIEKDRNQVSTPPPYQVSDRANQIYQSLDFIADLHCDALLWDRDLTVQSDYGQVDFPRMQQANVALEAFTIVTKSPKGQNMQENSSEAMDNITPLSIVQGQPVSTWFGLLNRALYQCEKLKEFATDSKTPFQIIKSTQDLAAFIKLRESQPTAMAGFLGVEGAHCLEGSLENVDLLYESGVRMMGPTHFFDNELGGSAHGENGAGLTPFGEQVIDRMNELGMLIDLAHISPKMVDDILTRTTKPVIVSHIGVKKVLNSPRNLSDDQIRRIASNNGLIGIAFFAGAVGDGGIASIVKSMKHVRDLVGIEHVALGSDYDGSVTVPFDITGLPLLVEEMDKQGFSQAEIASVMGENVKRFLLKNL